jgi:hypothetical protein
MENGVHLLRQRLGLAFGARVVQPPDQRNRHQPRHRMRHQQGRQHPEWRYMGQDRALQQQQAKDADRTVGADARILHDLQHALLRHAAAETVAHVGKAVFMEGAGDVDAGGDRQDDGDHGREKLEGDNVDRAGDQRDDHTDQRKIARRLVEPSGIEAHPARDRQAREELQRGEEQSELVH